MLTGLNIEGYRCFESFRMEGLVRVNLLVGRNGAGKTTLLEGVHFLQSGGDSEVLRSHAYRRGEVSFHGEREHTRVNLAHLFRGHELQIGSRFFLAGENGGCSVEVSVGPMSQDAQVPTELIGRDEFNPPWCLLNISVHGEFTPKQMASNPNQLWLTGEGDVIPHVRPIRFAPNDRDDGPPHAFVSGDSVWPKSLPEMWDRVLEGRREAQVSQAMRVIEGDLEDIVFPSGDPRSLSRLAVPRILVGLAGSTRRLPMGSMGDGFRHFLSLCLAMSHAEGGCLLVDEIDTGLHYSVLSAMWKLVIETAKANNIQVFATTHSLDCVNGLAMMCRRNPGLVEQVSIHKIDRAINHSVNLTGEAIVDAVEGRIELR
ncbi:MAG: AAA family ATPase [Phycisphaerales bacterium]|nr:AAA family ATPase [Phycisphaerales bacterium]